jgi:hypothetical protein
MLASASLPLTAVGASRSRRAGPLRAAAGMIVAVIACAIGGDGRADENAAWASLRGGGVVLFRHAIAPGGGDPPGMKIGECATQRNLDEAGRAQARRIGEAFRARGVTVGAVLASQWCRAEETADLAFPGSRRAEPAFNSFFGSRASGPRQTEAARRIIAGWRGPGALVVFTHQVNVTALTDIVPASGEGLAVDPVSLRVIGRLRP